MPCLHQLASRTLPLLVVLIMANGFGCSDPATPTPNPIPDAGTNPDAGTVPECQVDEDCPETGTECATRSCDQGQCKVTFAPAGQRASEQVLGDCLVAQCDGQGRIEQVADDADISRDDNECTDDLCTAAGPIHPTSDPGSACSSNGGSLCDGAGHCVACITEQDCPGVDTECSVRTCVNNVCGVSHHPVGTPVMNQIAHDCQAVQCDGNGGTTSVADDTDTPDDGNPCTTDTCVDGEPDHDPVEASQSCGEGLICDGAGACVGCVTADDCPGVDTECRIRTCVMGQCGVFDTAPGTVVSAQIAGDCLQAQCDGMGGVTNVPLDTDVPSDENECTADSCAAGLAKHTPLAARNVCGSGGGSLCDGAGACVECLVADDCPGTDTDCSTRTCNAGVCGADNAAAGTPVTTQTAGDCQFVICDGNGGSRSEADNTDVPNDGLECTTDSCSNGAPTYAPKAINTSCTLSTSVAGYCGGGTACVECTENAQCSSGICTSGTCADPSCEDGVQNGAETGIDCGGSCDACPVDASAFALRCTFSTANGGSGTCDVPTTAFSQTGLDNYTVLGGQNARVTLAASGVTYDSTNHVLSFSATVKNLLPQMLGTIDGKTLASKGVRLVLNNTTVTSGTGLVTAANADGTDVFLTPGLSYFQYDQKLAQNETSAAKTIQLNVPSTVNTFTADFLVSTKVAVKLVINEILVNPGGTITDANGEWFEVYNAGQFPVNMEGFRLADSSAAGDRPTHLISLSGAGLIIQPGGYLVFGNTTNTTLNGGVPVDYAYGAAMALANSLDVVRLISPDGYVNDTSVCAYNTPPVDCNQTNFVEIQRVRYSNAAVSAQDGISRELKNPALYNGEMDGSNWDHAQVTSVFGPGGRGTPGAQNSTYVP